MPFLWTQRATSVSITKVPTMVGTLHRPRDVVPPFLQALSPPTWIMTWMTGWVSFFFFFISARHFWFILVLASYQIYALKDGNSSETHSTALLRWWDAYPVFKSSPPSITAEEVAALIRDPALASTFAIIDVRRNDHAVCPQQFDLG